ncbi:MAG: hypothetical protein ABEJ57_05290 [Halobacteriaceae archaeon]
MATDRDDSLPWYLKVVIAIAILLVVFVILLDLQEFAAVLVTASTPLTTGRGASRPAPGS